MTDFAVLLQPDKGQPATPLHVVDTTGLDAWLATQPAPVRAMLKATGFKAAADSVAMVPHDGAMIAVAGVADATALRPWSLARAADTLPEGAYRLANGAPGDAALGWLLAHYRFDRYKKDEVAKGARILLTNDPARIDAMVGEVQAVALVRDMVNTPAADMGPAEIAAEAERLAKAHNATVTIVEGAELERGYPMIHAVGRAAARSHAPRLVELLWGDERHPRLAIVGKGVAFDSGGLDIKPGSGMRHMKKDMGGAAHAIALAGLIMRARLKVRLHLLIPTVENAIAGNAFRPGDVLTSRKGLTVEVTNTDAEGRLILGDALTRACETPPALLIDFATLTGAARVALGPDLPATFSNDDDLAADALAAGIAADDPLWRLPLHDGYDDSMKSDVADLTNSPDGGMAGAVMAALFLRRFVEPGIPWLHLDTFAWMPSAKPGRPRGGDALGLRAIWGLLRRRFN
ncbi:Leucyl aminopeptidase [Sphingomonas antarctica]|uniref:leucyl aminopeptidase family protein n=1 Tax=Sphingomonas antarctica TaxID=2040274 RepID=UPI0039ECACA3